jgi:hypothetical protein
MSAHDSPADTRPRRTCIQRNPTPAIACQPTEPEHAECVRWEHVGNRVLVFARLADVVLTETDDGQAGHSTMKLVDIVRADVDPLLFLIPSDYAVKDTHPATASTKH